MSDLDSFMTGLRALELTLEQQRAARACGFAFFPATTAQVQRLTMQKRIFRLGGQPFMATRDGAFWETHGTLMRLLPEQGQDEPQTATDPPEQSPQQPQPGQATKGAAAGPAQVAIETAMSEAGSPEGGVPAEAKPRRRRASAKVTSHADGDNVAVANLGTTSVEHGVTDIQQAAEASGEVTVEPNDEPEGVARHPRSRQQKEPRWATAGKQRRGRLK